MAHADEVTAGTLKRVLEAFNRHDVDVIMTFFADDCVLEMPRGPDHGAGGLSGN